MYKLFLSLRYLRKRIIAYFAVLAVALCVAMMVIVVSVMNGFLNKIEEAAKGLYGDIILTSGQAWGMEDYDPFIKHLEATVPEVESASPYIFCYGAVRLKPLPGEPAARGGMLINYREGVQLVGIRLPERARVSDFEDGLFVQEGDDAPSWTPPLATMLEANRRHYAFCQQQIQAIRDKYGSVPPPEQADLLGRLLNAARFQENALEYLGEAVSGDLEARIALLTAEYERLIADPNADAARIDQLAGLISELMVRPPHQRAIIGATLPGLSFRLDDGKLVRLWTPGRKVVIYALPLEEVGALTPKFELTEAMVVDCSRTGVYSIDNSTIYLPFETLQKLNHMEDPARASQIHIKVRSGVDDEASLQAVARKVQAAWLSFAARAPRDPREGAVTARTWRQVQAAVIEPIEAQRTMMVVILGVISVVAVFLIFVIFYMVVLQKTRDIGILKSIGASAPGVAGIFLIYGVIIGLVGSVIGSILGSVFVQRINPIHDWVGATFGLRIWRMETFLFDTIPNEVDTDALVWIIAGAMVAGLLGALIPAVKAGRMQPVEALRYE